MALNYNNRVGIMIRLGKSLSLIFFGFLIGFSCKRDKKEEIIIIWKDNQAVAIAVSKSLLSNGSPDSMSKHLRVCLENTNPATILGEYRNKDDEYIFQPLVPFTRGLNYQIFSGNHQIGRIEIPKADTTEAPSLISVYPGNDTLPENLLKFYFQFSRPMREGQSQQHITLLNEQNDTVQNVFLDLQPELWNTQRTVLTVWLDPGRIKRDLIPNRQMGNPLVKGKRYTLCVSPNWKDVQGLPLTQVSKRPFIVGLRDSISPSPLRWKLKLPQVQTSQPLVIDTGESLDYFLMQETIAVFNGEENNIKGTLQVSNKERTIAFIPDIPWQSGRYTLRVAAHLEDLAGNNLNKPFDQDITTKPPPTEKAKFEVPFILSPM